MLLDSPGRVLSIKERIFAIWPFVIRLSNLHAAPLLLRSSAKPRFEHPSEGLPPTPCHDHLVCACIFVSCMFALQFCEPSKGSRLARLPVLRFGRQTKEPRIPCPHGCCDAAPGNEGKVQVHTTPGGEEATSLTVPQGMWVIGQWAFPCMSEAASAA